MRPPALLGLAALLAPGLARAGDVLTVLEGRVDPPTLHTVGVQVLIADDDDRDATVAVRVREVGAPAWEDALPLLRVRPETVAVAVPQQFAGSVFDRLPGRAYEVELRFVDPDGLDTTAVLIAPTRPLPADPQHPVAVAVADVPGLQAALAAAAPGHVITLAPGTYAGSFFTLNASGTAADPIVLRGADPAAVVLDGQGCAGCNILEVYGSHVHVERMTFTAGERAIRFQGATTGNAVRHVTITDVVHGIAGNAGQSGFTICDNDVTGRLVWPWTFADDATAHWDDRGVDVTGDGHVVCHNRLQGFGDPVVNKKPQARAWDVYGNDILDAYDGTELDEGEGNTRLYLNRFTNVMNPVSIQPSHGGPAYVLRNVALNVPEEPIKLKSIGGEQEPSGALIYHNTFVSPNLALTLQAPITQHNFEIVNNLFVGPEQLAGPRTVDWTAVLDDGTFDHNGYWPDGGFWFGVVDGMNQIYASFAEAMASGQVEANGALLTRPIFAADFVGPADMMAHQDPADFELAAGSLAIDRARPLPGINDDAVAADLGARELGCPAPRYGPRPEGVDAVARVDCDPDDPGETDSGADATTADPPATDASGPGDPGTEIDTGWDSGITDPDGTATDGPPTGGEAPTAPTTTAADTTTTTAPADPPDDGGCACRGAPPPPPLAVLLALLRRRRSHLSRRTSDLS